MFCSDNIETHTFLSKFKVSEEESTVLISEKYYLVLEGIESFSFFKEHKQEIVYPKLAKRNWVKNSLFKDGSIQCLNKENKVIAILDSLIVTVNQDTESLDYYAILKQNVYFFNENN